jgi:hypothetical protein
MELADLGSTCRTICLRKQSHLQEIGCWALYIQRRLVTCVSFLKLCLGLLTWMTSTMSVTGLLWHPNLLDLWATAAVSVCKTSWWLSLHGRHVKSSLTSTFNLSLLYSTYSMIQPFADNMHSSWKILIQCHFRGSLCFIQYYRQQFWHFLLTVLFCPILVGKRRRWHGLLSSHNTIETCRCSRWKQTTSCGTIM